MIVPAQPSIGALPHISPASYEASLACPAKAAWFAFGDRKLLPDHPAAMLGTCFHAVVAAAHKGSLVGEGEPLRAAARDLFDQEAQRLYRGVHPLLKEKYSCVERLPYYYIQRERAVVRADAISSARNAVGRAGRGVSIGEPRTESRLASNDGLIVGRPDHIDRPAETVVDYKTGAVSTNEQAGEVSGSEARQLRLYAYLAAENGVSVKSGVIVRGDGRRCSVSIPRAEAEAEADKARGQLRAVNDRIQSAPYFKSLASPSSANCAMCPCIPFCDAFWENASPAWADQCGVQVEGRVTEVATTAAGPSGLVTLSLNVRRGTLRAGPAAIEQIPGGWLTIGSAAPDTEDVVRVVHARLAGDGMEPVVVRVDKTLTSIWNIPRRPEAEKTADG